MEEESGHSFSNQQLIILLKNIRDKGWLIVKMAVRSIKIDSSVEDIAELIESIT